MSHLQASKQICHVELCKSASQRAVTAWQRVEPPSECQLEGSPPPRLRVGLWRQTRVQISTTPYSMRLGKLCYSLSFSFLVCELEIILPSSCDCWEDFKKVTWVTLQAKCIVISAEASALAACNSGAIMVVRIPSLLMSGHSDFSFQ